MIVDPKILQQIVSNIEHIGSPPAISQKLLATMADPNYSATDLVEIIAQDATVSAQILKVANSVHFYRGTPVRTIKQAVVALGSTNIRSILFAIEMLGVFKGQGASKRFKEVDFLRHAVAGAIIASKYSQLESCDVDSDVVYIAALIRNIGVLALRQFVPGEFERILNLAEGEKTPFADASRAVVGKSHREIAYMIGSSWKLPQAITEAINPATDRASSTEAREIKNAILYADDLLQVTRFGIWDPYYMIVNVDFRDLPCEIIFKEATSMVDQMFGAARQT